MEQYCAIPPRAVILHGRLSDHPSEDDLDVLIQAQAVGESLSGMGFEVHPLVFSQDSDFSESLLRIDPDLVFNLVESVDSVGARSYLAPRLLETLHIPFTGCSARALFLSTNKVLTKRILKRLNIPTPGWATASGFDGFLPESTCIVKAVCEDASIGLSEKSVMQFASCAQARGFLRRLNSGSRTKFFSETYIDGREFSIAMLGQNGQPLLLPPLEMVFTGYEACQKVKIVDYKAKWDESSFEYQHTNSTPCTEISPALLEAMCRISKTCWEHFHLRGYARVDFRVDTQGRPWVLEINANPCITPSGSGFLKSAASAGLDFDAVVAAIVRDTPGFRFPLSAQNHDPQCEMVPEYT